MNSLTGAGEPCSGFAPRGGGCGARPNKPHHTRAPRQQPCMCMCMSLICMLACMHASMYVRIGHIAVRYDKRYHVMLHFVSFSYYLYDTISHCGRLLSTIFCSTILYYVLFYDVMLYYVLYCIVLHQIKLFRTIAFYNKMLCYIMLYFITFWYTVSYCIEICYQIILYYIVFQHII